MKKASLVCIGAAIGIMLLGIIAKYVLPVGAARPASFLQLTTILLLLGINFALLELMKK